MPTTLHQNKRRPLHQNRTNMNLSVRTSLFFFFFHVSRCNGDDLQTFSIINISSFRSQVPDAAKKAPRRWEIKMPAPPASSGRFSFAAIRVRFSEGGQPTTRTFTKEPKPRHRNLISANFFFNTELATFFRACAPLHPSSASKKGRVREDSGDPACGVQNCPGSGESGRMEAGKSRLRARTHKQALCY